VTFKKIQQHFSHVEFHLKIMELSTKRKMTQLTKHDFLSAEVYASLFNLFYPMFSRSPLHPARVHPCSSLGLRLSHYWQKLHVFEVTVFLLNLAECS